MRSLSSSVMGILMVAAAVGCGEPFTLTGSSGTGTTSSGGMGGSASTSTTTSTSSGPPACTPGDLTSCMGAGQYCAATMPPSCLPCSDLSRFVVGQPQKLAFMLPDVTMMTTMNPSFPRIGLSNGTAGGLYFTYTVTDGMNSHQDIGQADLTSPMQWKKGVAENGLVNTTSGEAGELLLPTGDAISKLVGMVDTTKPILLFHRVDSTVVPPTEKIFASDGMMAEEVILPSLPPPANTRNYNIAVAMKANPPQLWYMSNINKTTQDELVTNMPGSSMSSSILVTLDNGCVATGSITPWVDPTGHWLLISSPYLDSGSVPPCKQIAGAVSHLFYSDLTTATPLLLQAKPIFPGDKTNRTTPAMSDDLCQLYYTEINGGSTDVFSAPRQ